MRKADTPPDRCPRTGDMFFDLLPPPEAAGESTSGEGRPGRPRRARRGGGFPGAPGAPDLPADIRLRELEEIGLQRVWLQVAQQIGIDNFFAMWKLLSARPELINDDNQIEIRLRRFASYQKYQRNRYIETLVRAGLKPFEVRQVIRRDLGENLTDRHVQRLCRNARLRG